MSLTPRVLIFAILVGMGEPALSQSNRVTVAWDYSPDVLAIGYKVYWGTGPRSYQFETNAGLSNMVVIGGLSPAVKYHFTATAYDLAGLESDFSNEASYAVPAKLIRVTAFESTSATGPWTTFTNWPAVTFTNAQGNGFFKLGITNWSYP